MEIKLQTVIGEHAAQFAKHRFNETTKYIHLSTGINNHDVLLSVSFN